MHFLVQRAEQASSNEIERRLFMTILRKAYEDTLELETLYHELPGIFRDDHPSTSNFKELAERYASIRTDPKSRPNGNIKRRCDDEYKVDNSSLGNFPFKPVFLIKPSRLSLIMAGAERVSAGDNDILNRYAKNIGDLWDKSRFLERLYRKALRGIETNGRDPLGEYLRLVVRDCRIMENREEEQETISVAERSNFFRASSLSMSYTDQASAERIPRSYLLANQAIRWPPPDDDIPIDSDGTDACRRAVLIGSRRIRPLPISTYADGITSISPPSACEGQSIDINGAGFGPSRPADVYVFIGSTNALVTSWSDSRITVTVPVGATSGCVGFRNETIDAERQRIHLKNESIRMEIASACGYDGIEMPYVAPIPPCTGSNFFAGTLPEIDTFLVNGRSDLTVPPQTMLTLTWQIRNATTFRIRRISPDGPPVDIIDPPGNSFDIGIFADLRPLDAVYELSANNQCGVVSRNLSVHFRTYPALKILGIELIQVIQRFNLSDQSMNNSVRLRARKKTIARLYVDSGITNGFDSGEGPNNQPNVTGSVEVFRQASGGGINVGPPLNAGGIVLARPLNNIDRNDITHTLNFELPWEQLVGKTRIEAKVWVGGHENDVNTGWQSRFTYTGVQFHISAPQIIVRILVRDKWIRPEPLERNPPIPIEYNISLQGARIRMPVSEDTFVTYLAPGFEIIDCDWSLRRREGWEKLLDVLDDIADGFEDLGQIMAALVPNDRRYAMGGMALRRLEAVVLV